MMELRKIFKSLFFVGLLLFFVSLFLDWYYIEIYNLDSVMISSWRYNVILEWNTNFGEDNTLNALFRPNNLEISPVIVILFIGAIGLSFYIVAFRDLDTPEDLEKASSLYYVLLFLLCLNGFFIVVFPVFYLVGGGNYFPFMTYNVSNLELIFQCFIGPGYYLQMLGFILVFPYSIFYYQTTMQFTNAKRDPAKVVERYIESISEKVDLDLLISKELLAEREGISVDKNTIPLSQKKRIKS